MFIPEDAGSFRFRRSVLFMPASNERAIGKAAWLACDGVIFDLEDSVSEADIPKALENLSALVKDGDFGDKETVIRTSEVGSMHFEEDFAVAAACNVDAILLPKVETVADVMNVARKLEMHQCASALWAMVETPLALMNLRDICQQCGPMAEGGLTGLIVGPNDLAKTTGVSLADGRAAMQPWLMQVIATARAFGLFVLDGVYNNFRDTDGLAVECAEGARMGFDGKTLIHPAQIKAANAAFGPSDGELARARQIVEAFKQPEHANSGAIQMDGEMVERLHLDMAEKLLEIAGE